MANRKRLTKDGFSRRAADVENADPNSLNRVRHVPDAEQYATWDPEAHENHEKPDMRHDWQGDKDLRHPTLNIAMPGGERQANLALLRTAQTLAKKSSLAIKVASALFPEGTDTFIEKQATDLMDLPLRSLVDTVARINKYAAEMVEMDSLEDMGPMGDEDEDGMPPMGGDMGMSPAAAGGQEEWQRGGESEQMADFGEPANMPPAESVSSIGDVPPVSLDGEDVAPEAEDGEEDLDLDLDLGGDGGSEVDGIGGAVSETPEGEDEEEEDVPAVEKAANRTKTASKNNNALAPKRGVKKIASAPRANGAGSLDVSDLSRLWKSDPDVSGHFNY